MFTNGRIIVTGRRVRRGKQRGADYLLNFRHDVSLALVEAKETDLPAETGVKQARESAETLGLKLAYATKGQRIIEIDYVAGTEREVERYAWRRSTGVASAAPNSRACCPVRATHSRADNCCDAVRTIELAACACIAAEQGSVGAGLLRRDVLVGAVGRGIECVNKATIEPREVSVMTLNGLSMRGIGVSNEPR